MFQLSCGLTCGNSCVPLWAMQHLGFPNNRIIWIPLSSGMSFLFVFFTFKRVFMKMVLMVTQFPLQLLGDYLKV